MSESVIVPVDGAESIKSRILAIRGVQVMLASDLAELYGVEVKHLHRQVKRNIERFPDDFVIHVSAEEARTLRCQNITSKRGGDRYGLLAFTEQGVAMLSSVLKSERAAKVNVAIMRAFVSMRRAIVSIAPLVARMEAAEVRQLRLEDAQSRNEERFDVIFKAMDGGEFPAQKVFFEGKHYEAYSFARKLVKKAKNSVVLVDPFVDEVTLDILAQKKGEVEVLVATQKKYLPSEVAIAKFNKQNPTLTVKATSHFHDRFLIIDDKELYHFGASLKDIGRHYCAVSKMDAIFIPSIQAQI